MRPVALVIACVAAVTTLGARRADARSCASGDEVLFPPDGATGVAQNLALRRRRLQIV